MLEYAINRTRDFLELMPKKERKKRGQFFTSKETAEFMAGLFSFENLNGTIDMLDPGCGTGILTAALVERLQSSERIDEIKLTCYETDTNVIDVLQQNLRNIQENCKKKFSYIIRQEDYLLTQSHNFENDLLAEKEPIKYDIIIGNPPYLRVMKDYPAAVAMPTVVHGAPNLYFLFTAMSLYNLKPHAEMVYIIPRSWTSGAYFEAFRKYLFANGVLLNIHLFESRDKVFSQEQVLQETIIIRLRKGQDQPDSIVLSSSQNNNDFENVHIINVPYSTVVVGNEHYVFLPTDAEAIKVIQKINQYSKPLPDYGIRMKTGIVVDFRQYDDLRKDKGEDTCPLFYSQHIKDGRVNHLPSGKETDWISTKRRSLIQKNKDYVFCKRFTAKEERRRLQCGIYLKSDFSEYAFIGTQNKINFVEHTDGTEMDKQEVYGVYALLNSTLFDRYYRILNGSTQVNSTEINSIPVPDIEKIKEIGKCLLEREDLSTETCDIILTEVAYG